MSNNNFYILHNYKLKNLSLLSQGRERQRELISKLYPEELSDFDIKCKAELSEERNKIAKWSNEYTKNTSQHSSLNKYLSTPGYHQTNFLNEDMEQFIVTLILGIPVIILCYCMLCNEIPTWLARWIV